MHKVKQPKVSVIIPTHNRAEMLKRAVKSVLTQTWEGKFELIIISDGSTDNTKEVVRSFNDSRIRFFKHEKARGASAARNTGLREAKGEYIAFLDDDDEWTPNKLEVQMPVIENSGQKIGLVYAWIEYIEGGKQQYVKNPKLHGDIFEEMLDSQAITNSSALIIKRKVLDKVYGFDEELPRGNDGDFIRRISKHFHVDFVPAVLAKINIGRDDRISINDKLGLTHEIFALRKRLELFCADFIKYPDQKVSILMRISLDYLLIGKFWSCLKYLIQAFLNPGRNKMKFIALFNNLKVTFHRLFH